MKRMVMLLRKGLNPMAGKRIKFSVYGDSLSTLAGYQSDRYAVHYQGSSLKNRM